MSELEMPNSALGDRTCDCPFTEHGTGAGAVRRTSHLPDCLWLMAQSNPTDLLARLRTVEAERQAAWEVVQRFLTEDEADDPDEPKPTLAALVKRCFDWGDGAWYQAGTQMEAHLAAEARVEALTEAASDALSWWENHGLFDPDDVSFGTVLDVLRAALAVSGNQPQ